VSAEPLARLYDLALRTLDEQERADALRGRLGPTLAAAALGVTLLSGPVVGDDPPHGVAGHLALLVAVGGLAVTVGATFHLLSVRHRPDPELAPRKLLAELAEDGILDEDAAFYAAMIMRLDDVQGRHHMRIEQLTTTFKAMLCGILIMLCGLALAALVA